VAQPNIILTGFMGTGKTSVGRYLAERLNRPFVDLDERIVARAGKPIPAIFAEDGEAAFRELEAAACLELAEPQGVVAATGGGAAVNPANRAALSRGGLLICLDAHLEALLVRLEGYSGRPMLDGGDLRERVKELLAQRADAYAAITHHVDTTGHSVAAAAARVLALLAGLPENGQRSVCWSGRTQAGTTSSLPKGCWRRRASGCRRQGCPRAAAQSSRTRPLERTMPRCSSHR